MATPVLLQHTETGTSAWWVNGGTSDVITFGSPTTANSLFVLMVKTMSNVAISTVTDTQGNAWTIGNKTADSGGASIQPAWALLTVGGSAPTVTVTFAGTVAQASASIAEFSNIQNVRDINLYPTLESNTGSSTAPSTIIQSTVPGDLAITVCDGGTTNTHLQYTGPTDSGNGANTYTQVPVQAFVDADSFAWAYAVLNTNSIVNANWTLTNTGTWAAIVFSFAPAVIPQVTPQTQSDSFARANQAPLAGNWTTWGSAAALNLTGNAVVPSSTTLICGSYWNANSFGDDHFSQVTVVSIASGGSAAGPAVRMSTNGSATNGYCGEIQSNGVMAIQKIVSGVRTTLGTAVATATTIGDVIRLSVSKGLLTLSKNGTVVRSIYDATFPTGGAPGIMIFQNSATSPSTFNNWSGGQLGDSRFYQSTVFGNDGSQTSYVGGFTIANLAKSLLIACVAWPDASDPSVAISDTQNNTWVKLPGNTGQTLFYALSAKPGLNVMTVSRTGAGHLPCTAAEYTSSNGLGWLFDSTTQNKSTTTACTGTLTTAQANELIIGYLEAAGNAPVGPVPNGAFRNAWTGEVKLYDQSAPIAGSNTFTGTPCDNNGAPTSLSQSTFLTAFAPVLPPSASNTFIQNPQDAGPGSNTPVLLFSPPLQGLEVHISQTRPASENKPVVPVGQNLIQGVNPDGPADAAFSVFALPGGTKVITPTGIKFSNPA